MDDITQKLNEAEVLMHENTCLLELMEGYCVYAMENEGSITNLLPGFEIVLGKQKKLEQKIDDITEDVLKTNYPHWFKT